MKTIYRNIAGHEYQMYLDPAGHIKIDHPDRPGMTLQEYYDFAEAWEERDYHRAMQQEIIDALEHGTDLIEVTREDLAMVPREHINIRIYQADRDRLAATMKYNQSMADRIHEILTGGD